MPASKGFGLNPQLPHVTTVGTLNDVLLGPLGASRWRIRKGWDLSAAMAVTLAWGVFHHHDHNDDNNHYRQATRFFHVTKNHGHTVIPKKYRRYLVHTCTHHVHFFALALWNPSFPGDTSNSCSIMGSCYVAVPALRNRNTRIYLPQKSKLLLLDGFGRFDP